MRPIIETGPRVTSRSVLRWQAEGYDLELTNPEVFDSAAFTSLIDAFEQTASTGGNTEFLFVLKTWAASPRSARVLRETCCSLLRWISTADEKPAPEQALAIWKFLFGQPVPTWCVWDPNSAEYRVDPTDWLVWYQSLSVGSCG
jgi:hypothetical protein